MEASYTAGMAIQGEQINQVQTKENTLCSDTNDYISGAKQCIFHYAKSYRLHHSTTPVATVILCY